MKKVIQVECDGVEWLYIPDVIYSKYDGDIERRLQLLAPYRKEWESDEKYPLVVFIPGSAWYKQEMYNSLPALSRLAERGIVVAAVQYRESTIARYPAQVEDVERAILYLVSKAEDFHIDADRIFLAGNSSGGHIALMTVLRSANGIKDVKEFHAGLVKGVIGESAPTDIYMCACNTIPDSMPEEFRPCKDLLGVSEITEDLDSGKEASCKMYIEKNTSLPPILLFHGVEDCQVDVNQSRYLHDLLAGAGKTVDYYEMEGTDHGGAAFWSGRILDIISSFIFGR